MLQKTAEQIFAVLVLLFYTGGIRPFISGSHPAAPLTMVLPHLVTVITLGILTLRWQSTLLTLIRTPLLWLMVIVVAISPFWSTMPGETWGEIAPLLRVTLFSLYLASRYSLKEILQLMGWALGLAAVLSVFFGAFLPSYGVMGRGYIGQSQDWTHEGSWRGIYSHKVTLGSIMALSILVSVYLASWKNSLRPLALIAIFMAMLALMMSTTKAALGVLIVVLGCIPIYRTLRWKATQLALFLAVGIPLGTLLIGGLLSNAGSILAAFGKTTTLSGRTEIWPLVIENIGHRPWFGYGYHTFWLNGWEGDAANIWVYLPRGFEPSHSHNGFLDMLLSFGLVGFVVFGLNLIAFGWRAFRWARTNHSPEGLVPVLLLTFMMLINITESLWLKPDILWVCYATVAIVIATQPQPQTYLELYPLPKDWDSTGGLSPPSPVLRPDS